MVQLQYLSLIRFPRFWSTQELKQGTSGDPRTGSGYLAIGLELGLANGRD